MDPQDEKELRSRLAEAESLSLAIRNREVDAIHGDESILVLRMLEHNRESSRILESFPDVVFRLSKGNQILFVSPPIALYAGCPANELIGKNLSDFPLPEEARQRLDRCQKEVETHQEARDFVFAAKTNLGFRHLEVRLFPESDSGEPGAVVGIVSDVSRRQEALRRLRESDEKLRTAVEGARLGTFEYDPASRQFVHWNETFAEIFALDAENSPTTDHPFKSMDRSDSQTLRTLLDNAESGDPFQTEVRITTNPSELRWINFSGRKIENKNNDGLVTGITSDITTRKNLEEAAHSARTAAEDTAIRKGEFLAALSHEVRTPLTAILGFAEIMGENANPDIIKEGVASIRENGKLLLSIINSVLDLSKIEAGKMPIDWEEADPRKVVDQCVHLMKGSSVNSALSIETVFEDGLPETLVTDPQRLKQILSNLLSNAIKFTDVGRVGVEVTYSASESLFRFSVFDSGPGVEESFIPKLFEPFEQGGVAGRSSEPGTGLGLSICQELASSMGGRLELDATGPEGSVFALYLPASSQPGENSKTASKPNTTRTNRSDGTDLLARQNILVVEDQRAVRSMLVHYLEQFGAIPKMVGDGESALHLALQDDANLSAILLDIRLPGISGLEVARRLRQGGFNHPIIACTAHAERVTREECIEAGCSDFLLKPFTRESLLRALRAENEKSA